MGFFFSSFFSGVFETRSQASQAAFVLVAEDGLELLKFLPHPHVPQVLGCAATTTSTEILLQITRGLLDVSFASILSNNATS